MRRKREEVGARESNERVLPRYARLGTRVSASRWSRPFVRRIDDRHELDRIAVTPLELCGGGQKGGRRKKEEEREREEAEEEEEEAWRHDTRVSEELTTRKVGIFCLPRDR